MKHSFIAFIAIGSIVLQPFTAHATEETNGDSWLRDSWAQSSENRRRIADLPTEVVTAVPIPILFGVGLTDISPNFGDARSGGRSHEGEDITATRGTPIVSPTKAVVLRTGEGPSEGLYVYTANPGGETFVYMHLDRIGEGVDKGAVLEKGDLVGYVGNTGNAIATLPHLHFEIHENGDPVDPFPRLSTEFTLNEKMAYTEKLLTKVSDPGTLARFLVDNFRSTFVSAKAAGITLSAGIADMLRSVTLPTNNLSQGSTGNEVRTLQNYLIETNTGSAARSLATAGATGYFGAVTKTALLEYQRSIGVSATGVYDAATRARISTAQPAPVQPTTPAPTTPTQPVTAYTFTRTLSKNMNGEDVKMLQKILNARGFTIAVSGPGSAGNETTYFGLATEAAVKKFQAAHGVSAIGVVGPGTRAVLNSLK